jgi:hypothetical protein
MLGKGVSNYWRAVSEARDAITSYVVLASRSLGHGSAWIPH